jgi:seryl-tRNA synthetase
MFDLRWIRENPDAFDAGLQKRGLEPMAETVLDLDKRRRASNTSMQDMQTRRNDVSKQIGLAKSKGQDVDALIAEVANLKDDLQSAERVVKDLDDEMTSILSGLPNRPYDDIPVGGDEDANELVRTVGTPRSFNFQPKQHFELGEDLGLMDFEAAAKISGARFVILRRQLARLERAIANFMLDLHTGEFGYQETTTPLLVREHAAYGTGNLPKFEEDLFKTTNDFYLIPTAEMTLTNTVREMILDEADLPMRLTALTPCFRSEAGSAGRDTRGMLRQHQFNKVELVSITTAETSDDELERMTSCAEEVLKRLEIAYRVMKLSSGDMSFSARRTYDLEAWLPGQNAYREISSCSVCGDFQARRMDARYRVEGEKGTRFVHTLNGSGMATGRTLIAVMENYQQEDGNIVVPEVLRPYLGGQEIIKSHG